MYIDYGEGAYPTNYMGIYDADLGEYRYPSKPPNLVISFTPASPEMEAYYAAYATLEAFDREVEKRHMIQQAESGDYRESYQRTPEEESERYDLFAALDDAKAKVPEWQNGEWGGRYW